MNKHTPGPWTMHGPNVKANHEGGPWLADCDLGVEILEAYANARLMAIAPDMLEELESILICVESGAGFLPHEYKLRIVDAIHKARGGE